MSSLAFFGSRWCRLWLFFSSHFAGCFWFKFQSNKSSGLSKSMLKFAYFSCKFYKELNNRIMLMMFNSECSCSEVGVAHNWSKKKSFLNRLLLAILILIRIFRDGFGIVFPLSPHKTAYKFFFNPKTNGSDYYSSTLFKIGSHHITGAQSFLNSLFYAAFTFLFSLFQSEFCNLQQQRS